MSNASLEYYAKKGLLGLDAHDAAQTGDTKAFGEMFPMVPDEIKYTPGSPMAPQIDEHSEEGMEKDNTSDHPLEFDEVEEDSRLASNKKSGLAGRLVASNSLSGPNELGIEGSVPSIPKEQSATAGAGQNVRTKAQADLNERLSRQGVPYAEIMKREQAAR